MITESDMLTEAKKMAVEMMFWPACPVDDDYCFDAIMYSIHQLLTGSLKMNMGYIFIRFTKNYAQHPN